MSETAQPSFPPLLRGEEVPRGMDPFAKAVAAAALGCDPGLLTWARREDRLDAALVLAPECKLEQAVGVAFAASIGMADAVGALSPPEVAFHHVWPGGFKINGADCGRLRAAAASEDPRAIPDWLVLGVTIPYLPPPGSEGGDAPDQTSLIEEGCVDVTPPFLLESWSRHVLVWINRWLDDGLAPLHSAWCERAWEMGEPLPDGSGLFMGLDELGGMLVKTPERTIVRPLTELLEAQ